MNKLVNLQILRGVAASLVVVDHSTEALILRGLLSDRWLNFAYFFGWLGVITFFAISGFIMVRSTPPSGKIAKVVADFLAKRVIRVVPMYWISTAVYFILLEVSGKRNGTISVIKSLMFIPYSKQGSTDMRPVVGQGWTLNYEIFFYAIFAACLIPHRKFGGAILISSILALVVSHFFLVDSFTYSIPKTPLQFWTDPIMIFFACGSVVGFVRGSDALRRSTICRCVSRRPLTTSCGLIAFNIAVFSVSGVTFPLPYAAQVGFGTAPVVAMLICTWNFERVESRATALLSRLGDASYSTYLFHPLAIFAMAAVYGRLPAEVRSPVAFVLLAIVVSNLVGLAVYATIERPTTAVLRRMFSTSPRAIRLHANAIDDPSVTVAIDRQGAPTADSSRA